MGNIQKYLGVDVHSIKDVYFRIILRIYDENLTCKRTIEEYSQLMKERNQFIMDYLEKHPELEKSIGHIYFE